MPAPFTLGVFTGNADSEAISAMAAFNADMGTPATIFAAYIDFTQPPSGWQGNNSWFAGVCQAAGWLKTMIPSIHLPMGSTNTSVSTQTILENYVNGTYDSMVDGMVQAWANAGAKTQIWRPGVEMNLNSTNGFVGSDASLQKLWCQAFQAIYTQLHASGTKYGVALEVVWNPGICGYSAVGVVSETMWPGAQYVDVIGGDAYDSIWVSDETMAQVQASPTTLMAYYDTLDTPAGQSFTMDVMIAFAKAQGKPIAICETGCGQYGENPVWPQWLAGKLAGAVAEGVPVKYVLIWNSNGGVPDMFTDGSKPTETAAWAEYFGVNSTVVLTPPSTTTTTTTTPPPTTTPPTSTTPTFTVSSPKTIIQNNDGKFITDTEGQVWTIKNSQFYIGSTVVSSSWNVTTGYWGESNDLWQLNTSNNWYKQPLSNTSGTPSSSPPPGFVAPNPAVTTTPPVTTTTTPPVTTTPPATTTTPSFKVSAAGAQIPAPPIVTSTGNAWTLPTKGGQIFRQAPGDAAPSAVKTSLNVVAIVAVENGTTVGLVQLNTYGQWWTQPEDGSAGTQTTAPAGYAAVD